LVKDGATAIEALGDGIDTSLVDLKGGTTGQVLSKASGTDMDFAWVAQDDSNAIQNAIVDAKGDLIAATAADTPARLAVGTNGQVLTADSTAATGLAWATPSAGAAYPAGKNVLINGLLDIWQRSTSVTFSATGGYNAQDRWYNYAGQSSTFARESSIVPTGCTYSCKITVGASAAALQSEQAIETLNAAPYAGSTMTFSGYFQSSATPTISYAVYYSTATDVAVNGAWTAITATSGGSGTAGASSFTRISGVYAIPSTAKSLKVLWYSSTVASGGVVYWGGMQFEASSVPTTLVRNAATIQGELAACQRYYWRFGGAAFNYIGTGRCTSTTQAYAYIQYPVTMRTAPTFARNAVGDWQINGFGLSVFAIDIATTTSAGMNCQTAGGLSANGGANLLATNNTTNWLDFSAEL
jgi:hypothetical protein